MKLRDVRRRALAAMNSGEVIELRLPPVLAVMIQHKRQPAEFVAQAMRDHLKRAKETAR